MALKNPKAKGNQFERQIYYDLAARFGNDRVKRSLGSGSTKEPADIQVFDEVGRIMFAIDTKHYKPLTWGEIDKMFYKLEAECKAKTVDGFEATPILVIKINGSRVLEVVRRDSGIVTRCKYDDWLKLVDMLESIE